MNAVNKELRPSVREEDPRETAKRRAAEIRGDGLHFDDLHDEFSAPTPPEGWSYEWKRKSVYNMEDHTHLNTCLRMGWTPVPAKRHPEMMQFGYEGPIERKGSILMERPSEITEESKMRGQLRAQEQINLKQGITSDKGLLGRADSRVQSSERITKTYEKMPIPTS